MTTPADRWAITVPSDGIDASTFDKPLLKREDFPLEGRRVARFELHDSSLMGRMRQGSLRAICAELRKALREEGGGKGAIARDMQQRGCWEQQ